MYGIPTELPRICPSALYSSRRSVTPLILVSGTINLLGRKVGLTKHILYLSASLGDLPRVTQLACDRAEVKTPHLTLHPRLFPPHQLPPPSDPVSFSLHEEPLLHRQDQWLTTCWLPSHTDTNPYKVKCRFEFQLDFALSRTCARRLYPQAVLEQFTSALYEITMIIILDPPNYT